MPRHWRYRFLAWLRHHPRLGKASIIAVVVALVLSTLSYVGNQSGGIPDSVPLLGGDRPLIPGFRPGLDCALDPALADGSVSAPGPGPDGQPSNYLHTCGRYLFDSQGREVTITGINWFGMETETGAPDGLWTRNWQSVLDQVVALGYNTLRLPYSNEMIASTDPSPAINYIVNPDLKGLSGVQLMDKIIEGARARGLRVVLDRHRPTSAGQSALWYTAEVSEQRWIDDWVMLARRYRGVDTVIGFDLHNEPRDSATWGSNDHATDWRMAAKRAGNAVLEANPYLLIFVEGVSNYNNDYYWWGGHLAGVAQNPVTLAVPNRVVYSPHDYGPEVFQQGWFSDPTFPRNLPAVWDAHWGYLARQNVAPVVVGEFGGRSVGADPEGVWQRALLEYMRRNHIGFFNWSLNPNSADTGGLLSDDWLNVMADKQSVYQQYLAPPIGTGLDGRLGPPKGKVKVLYRALDVEPRTSNIAFSLQIVNDGPAPLDLSQVEARYWFSSGALQGRQQLVDVDHAAVGNDKVRASVVSVPQSSQDSYLSLSFVGDTTVAPYQSSGDIMLRIHKSDWSAYAQAEDFSFAGRLDWVEWDRVTLYRDGKLVWGDEPRAIAAGGDR